MHCGAVCGGEVWEGTMSPAQLLPCFQSLPLLPTDKLALVVLIHHMDGFVYVLRSRGPLQQTLLWDWEFLPLLQPPQIFTASSFWGFIFQCWNPGVCGLSCSPVIPPSLSAHEWDHLVCQPLPCCVSSLPSLPVWMNISSYSLVVRLPYSLNFWQFWLFLFLNLLLFFFCLCKEAKLRYLCLHLGQKSVHNIFLQSFAFLWCQLLFLLFHFWFYLFGSFFLFLHKSG